MAIEVEKALAGLPQKLLVGVSGGLDSVALLHALVKTGRKPLVLHFDHGWRVESVADAAWVRQLAKRLSLRFIGGRGRPAPKTKREAQAREARYAFFARAAEKTGCRDLVLAHQADDQVETFLLQLLRGSGAAGRGMDPIAQRGGLTIHRPWLAVTRKEIAAYARREKLSWREDPSNHDLSHRRNVIRQRVLPYLRKTVTPAAAENLWRAAEIARAESAWLDTLCAKMAAKPELPVAALRDSSLGEQRRTILRWLQTRGIADISFAEVEAVRRMLTEVAPARVNLSRGCFARRRSGKLFVERADA